ncbi:MAG TPA: type 2 lanthipeptide synthetase LanM [Chthoniobacterales bacterium]
MHLSDATWEAAEQRLKRLFAELSVGECAPLAQGVFDNLVQPLVRHAWAEVDTADLLTLRAAESLRKSIVARLLWTGRQGFEWNYNVFLQTPGLPRAVREDPVAANEVFFPRGLEREALRIMESYPELARLWALQLEAWVVFVREFLGHARAFFGDKPPIQDLELDCSDHHHCHRSVVRVADRDGKSWFYKPRSKHHEHAWFSLLQWLNDERFPSAFYIPELHSLDEHCWMVAVIPQPCRLEDEVKSFYFRAGAQLYLFYVLGGTDLHADNLVACGAHPVVIDCETLFHPKITEAGASDSLEQSVLRCGMLPFPRAGSEVSSSALCCDEPGPHAVFCGEQRIDPAAYVDDIVSGYSQMHQFLTNNQRRRLTFCARTSALAKESWRHVVRPTSHYRAALEHSLSPTFLRNGTARTEALRQFVGDGATSGAEFCALEVCDIPIFHQPGTARPFFFDPDLENSLGHIRSALKTAKLT